MSELDLDLATIDQAMAQVLDEQAASLASRHHAAPDDTRPVQAQPLVRFHARHCCKKLVGYRAGVLILVDVGGRLKG